MSALLLMGDDIILLGAQRPGVLLLSVLGLVGFRGAPPLGIIRSDVLLLGPCSAPAAESEGFGNGTNPATGGPGGEAPGAFYPIRFKIFRNSAS